MELRKYLYQCKDLVAEATFVPSKDATTFFHLKYLGRCAMDVVNMIGKTERIKDFVTLVNFRHSDSK